MFFVAILTILVMILTLFKPLKIKEQKFVDVPLLDMSKFIMYELDTSGLQTFMSGEQSLRFKDRYRVNNIDFTDSSRSFISNMKADVGIYKNDIVDLKGNITFIREDGLEIRSQKLIYNRKNSIANSPTKYTSVMGKSKASGSSIVYDAKNRKVKSKNIRVIYDLQERK